MKVYIILLFLLLGLRLSTEVSLENGDQHYSKNEYRDFYALALETESYRLKKHQSESSSTDFTGDLYIGDNFVFTRSLKLELATYRNFSYFQFHSKRNSGLSPPNDFLI